MADSDSCPAQNPDIGSLGFGRAFAELSRPCSVLLVAVYMSPTPEPGCPCGTAHPGTVKQTTANDKYPSPAAPNLSTDGLDFGIAAVA
jgi:hypothetical protein